MIPVLSVVIPSFNSLKTLTLTLESLGEQTLGAARFEVVVVDDGSSDGTSEWLEGRKFPYELQLIRFPSNGGCSRTRNAGVARARSPLILFVDSDMFCTPTLLQKHLDAYRGGDRHAVVGRVLTHSSIPTTALTRWFDSKNPAHGTPTLAPTRFITQNLSIPASVFREVGGFDEWFRAYGIEDIDIGLRLAKLPGYELRYLPDALAFHCQDEKLEEKLDKVSRTGRHNLGYLCSKFSIEIRSLGLAQFVPLPGEKPGLRKRLIQLAMTSSVVRRMLLRLAHQLPDGFFHRKVFDFLFAQALFRGYRESQRKHVQPMQVGSVSGY